MISRHRSPLAPAPAGTPTRRPLLGDARREEPLGRSLRLAIFFLVVVYPPPPSLGHLCCPRLHVRAAARTRLREAGERGWAWRCHHGWLAVSARLRRNPERVPRGRVGRCSLNNTLVKQRRPSGGAMPRSVMRRCVSGAVVTRRPVCRAQELHYTVPHHYGPRIHIDMASKALDKVLTYDAHCYAALTYNTHCYSAHRYTLHWQFYIPVTVGQLRPCPHHFSTPLTLEPRILRRAGRQSFICQRQPWQCRPQGQGRGASSPTRCRTTTPA